MRVCMAGTGAGSESSSKFVQGIHRLPQCPQNLCQLKPHIPTVYLMTLQLCFFQQLQRFAE